MPIGANVQPFPDENGLVTAPVPPPLRPLTLGELLDVSFGLYRSMFFTLLVVAVSVHLIPTLLQVYLQSSAGMYSFWPLTIAVLLLSTILNALGVAATTHVVSEAYLGRRPSAGEALRRAIPLIWRLIVISLLTWLLVGIGLFLLIVPGLILMSGLLLSPVVVVVESPPGATSAMARSWGLSRGYLGKVFGTVLVSFLLLLIPAAAVAGVLGAVGQASPSNSMIAEVLSAVLQVLVYPYVYTVITLVYYDLRVRKEGFDLELLAAAASQPA